MNKVYVVNAMLEKCSKNKEKIDFIMPHTALHYIVDGYGYFNGVRLGKGDYFCAVENEKACYYPDKCDPWTYIFFDLKGSGIKDVVNDFKFLSENSCGKFQSSEKVFDILNLYKNFSKTNEDTKLFRTSIANLLLSLNLNTQRAEISVVDSNVKKIKEYIDLNFNKKISMDLIARELYISRAYARNIFFAKMGVSPKQYLQSIRMEKSARLLVDTAFSIGEIAIAVGYADQLAFSREFKKCYSVSPLNYRKSKCKNKKL